MQVGIIGGSGAIGTALAARLGASGHTVVIGSRELARASDSADALIKKWPDRDLDVKSAENHLAAESETVIVATPWEVTIDAIVPLTASLDGKTVVSVVNPVVRIGGKIEPVVLPRGSMGATLQAALSGSNVAVAFNHFPAKELGDLNHELMADVLVCADSPDALETICGLVDGLPGLRAVRAGGLDKAGVIEAFTSVLIEVNRGYRTLVTPRLNGLDS